MLLEYTRMTTRTQSFTMLDVGEGMRITDDWEKQYGSKKPSNDRLAGESNPQSSQLGSNC